MDEYAADWYYEVGYAERQSYERGLALQGEVEAYWAAEREAEDAMYNWFYMWHCEMDDVFDPFYEIEDVMELL